MSVRPSHDETPVLLRLRNLTAGYERRPIVRAVSLELGPGEWVGLYGLNGAGKSTLIKAIAGVEVWVRAEELRLGDEDFRDWPTWRRARAGIVYHPQGAPVFGSMTVEDNLTFAARGLVGPDRDERRERIEAVLASTVPSLISSRAKPAQLLSRGERQALALAMTFLSAAEPRLLLLDEPVTDLDWEPAEKLLRALQEIPSQGRNIKPAALLVKHRIPLGLALTDRFLLMHRGTIFMDGRANETDEGTIMEHLLERAGVALHR